MNTLNDLINHLVKDMYSSEKQLVEALPKVMEHSTDFELKSAIEDHLEETKDHVQQLERVGDMLGLTFISGDNCEVMQALIKEEEGMAAAQNADVKDAIISVSAQKIEHYEIGSYEALKAMLNALYIDNADKASKIIDSILDQEKTALKRLARLSQGSFVTKGLNEEADER